ncbi:helix-turn-helix domain-containing protein [Kineosporia sp. J2-2]|uniref:Helix-turn-helix domain-containing protein n=1 Tax=Kineosporia corallincola TaxID=2835133 RepID=A0ABS5TG05_9ACTN|nr:helix-turn-helix transcriptional regulator [Kineosporia corallincola]MBT0770001.1 helix-turn-helix domain-containing protein [Kineosporia corallincola]
MSVVVRKSLGRQLAALRQAAGVTPSQVAGTKIASTSKLHRLEHGEVSVRLETVWALCDLYRASAEAKSRLSSMALNTAQNGWWEGFSDLLVSPHFGTYVELESAADELLAWEGELVHGLLQTPEYTAAVFDANPFPTRSAEDRRRQVEFRQERQRTVLDRARPIRLSFVLGEGTLLREIGGPTVLDRQRQHLLRIGQRPSVDISVLTWRAGAHALMRGSLHILGFDDSDVPDVVYVEGVLGGRYEEASATVSAQRAKYHLVRASATPIEEYLT